MVEPFPAVELSSAPHSERSGRASSTVPFPQPAILSINRRKAEAKLERIQPEQIIAIVVGIEKYADEELNVAGPAGDAKRFVRWLLDDCRVPAANIRLHLSPLDDFDEELPVQRLAAATDPIKHSLVHFPEQHPEAKLLILYWIGHGAYVPGRNDQSLYLATANQNCLDCLETGTLREFLQKHSWGQGACLRRLVFIDACANQRRPVATAALDLQAHPRNLQPKIQLCEMRSAALGQFANIRTDKASAYFSSALLNWLEGINSNRLLNRMEDLSEHLHRTMQTAREENDFDQRPLFWQLGDWDGKTKAQFSQSETAGIEEAERLLRGLNIPDNQFGSFYRRVSTRGRATTLGTMVDDLCDLQPGTNQLPRLLEFVARVADSQIAGKCSKPLWKLVESHTTSNQLATLQQMLAGEKRQASPIGERLLFDLKASNASPEKFMLEAWRQSPTGGFDPLPVPKSALTLAEVEQAVAMGIADSDQPFLEFFLPKELLSLKVDRWDYFGSAIGDMFPVIVRLRERSTGILPKQLLANWRTVSARIQHKFNPGEKPIACWLPNDKLPPGKLMPHVKDADFGACVAFAVPPEARPLEAILFGGAPYAVWPRELPVDAKKFRRKLDGKLGEAHLNNFPDRMRALRQIGDSGSEMTLLWDEPARNPFEKYTPLD